MREGNAAVLLSTTPDRHGNVGLLLNTGAYTANQSLEMDVHGKRYYLVPQRLVEAGEDFDLAKFRVLKNT
jgi:hypothetical protein